MPFSSARTRAGEDRDERRRVDRPALVRRAQQRLDARRSFARAPPPFDRRAAAEWVVGRDHEATVAERLVRQRLERDAAAPVVPR
jgi:hypothetical protein